MNNSSIVRKKTRELVTYHLNLLGYRRNAMAHGLKTNQSNLIGLVVPSITNSMYAEVAQAVVREAERQGYTMMIAVTERKADIELKVVNTFIDQSVAGILISPSESEGAATRLMVDHGVPAIEMLNRSDTDLCDVFEADNRAGAKIATEHLIACGHGKIGFIAGVHNSTAMSRFRGYSDALEWAGLPMTPELVVQGNYTREGGRSACRKMLDTGLPITAIFCASDLMAYGAMEELDARGLRIPDDMAIIGFDDMEMSSLPGVSLSSISFQPTILARKAISQLIAKIKRQDTEATCKHELQGCELVVRRSTMASFRTGAAR